MSHRIQKTAKMSTRGNLRIGDHWNAITIIALSQSNPLKAVAELVENSIDARAKTIVITRGKDKGQHYLRVKDDGEGVRRNGDGAPDFHYVATHVCDSIKQQLTTQATRGLHTERYEQRSTLRRWHRRYKTHTTCRPGRFPTSHDPASAKPREATLLLSCLLDSHISRRLYFNQ